MKTAQEINNSLPYFTGTESYHLYNSLRLTDGVTWLAKNAECFWLLGIVWSILPKLKGEEFVVVKLKTNLKKKTAKFTADDGNDNILYKQNIPLTDFPLEEIKLYLQNGVLMLTSEY